MNVKEEKHSKKKICTGTRRKEKCFRIKLFRSTKEKATERMENNKFVKLEKSVYKNKITVNNARDFLWYSCQTVLFFKHPAINCSLTFVPSSNVKKTMLLTQENFKDWRTHFLIAHIIFYFKSLTCMDEMRGEPARDIRSSHINKRDRKKENLYG